MYMVNLLTDELETQSIMNRFYTYQLTKCIDRMGSGGNYYDENDDKRSCDGLVILMDSTICPIFKNHSTILNGLEIPSHINKLPELIEGDVIRTHEFVPENGSLEESVRKYNEEIVSTAYTFPSCIPSYIVGFYSFINKW